MPRIDGIDVSQWNGSIDWPCVRANGCDWSAAQVLDRNNGNAEDPRYRENRHGMDVERFRHRLLYYFPVLDGSISIATQVDQYVRAIFAFEVGEAPGPPAPRPAVRGLFIPHPR